MHPTSASPKNVHNLLSTPAAGWLRPFLDLSIGLALGGDHEDVDTTFKLGTPRQIGVTASRASLTWCVFNTEELFEKFSGAFIVRSGRPGTTLTLSGTATGGEDTSNQRALRSLTQLVAAAASSYYDAKPASAIQLERAGTVPPGFPRQRGGQQVAGRL